MRRSVARQLHRPGEVSVVPDAICSEETRAKLIQDARSLRRLGQPGATGRNVLSYWWALTGMDASAWLLRFYEGVSFMTYISKHPENVASIS